jgi:ferredoxin-type protein NapH
MSADGKTEGRTSFVPGSKWKWLRRGCQAAALLAICVGPLLGGWQRLDRAEMALWQDAGWGLIPQIDKRLPLGGAPRRAYQALQLAGGGVAVDYFGLALMDPVAGAVSALASGWSWRFALAWSIPVIFALLFGRVFCGWFCPFGWLSRLVARLRERVFPFLPNYALPKRRPLRWLLLLLAAVGGALALEILFYLALPHLLLQQAAYAVWLLAGGGAALGAVLGLLLAGLLFGPTSYCAALCPTGLSLSLLGRRRLVKVGIEQASRCGSKCALCDAGCWLQLKPASGDPGPDCDSCGRCFEGCPSSNLRMRIAGGGAR